MQVLFPFSQRYLALMRRIPTRVAAIAALALVFLGSAFLDFEYSTTFGFVFLLLGFPALVAFSEAREEEKPGRPRKMWTMYLFVALGALLCLFISSTVSEEPTMSGQRQAGLWALGCACFVFAGYLSDWRRKAGLKLFEKNDWLWMGALACVSILARCVRLSAAPLGLVFDELEPLGDTVAIHRGVNRPAFFTDSFGHNGLFYHFNSLVVDRLGWLGLDLVQSAKIMTALCGGISVAALYAMTRLLGTRPLAATACVLLVCQGWHWVLSRLYYAYAGDLLWLSLSTSLLMVGLYSGRVAAIAGSAVTATLATAWLKTGVLAGPWAFLLMLDDLFVNWHDRKKRFKLYAIWLSIFIVTGAPLATQFIQQPHSRWRYQDIQTEHSAYLGKNNHSIVSGYVEGLKNVARVLLVQDAQRSRTSPRPGMPLLDAVLSGLAAIGCVWAVWNFRRNRAARILLLGFLVFTLPSIISYPEDAPAATSRRMAFCSFLVAWVAAQGAAIMVGGILPSRARFAGMIGLASASLVLNVYGLRACYGTTEYDWYDTLGSHRPPIIHAILEAAKAGPVLYYPNGAQYEGLDPILKHYSTVKIIKSTDELRQELSRHAGLVCTVVLPWATPTYEPPNDSPRWINDLSDIIPTSQWSWGPGDLRGVSIYRMAKVLIPRK